jgi:hypothetical protein
MIAVVAITALIGGGAAMAAATVSQQGTRNGAYTTANQHAMNAVYWISRDALMAQTVTTSGSTGFPLTLSWTDWDNSTSNVTYRLESGSLKRSCSVDGATTGETLIAQYISSGTGNTTCSFSGGVLQITVTTTVGTGAKAVHVTKEGSIAPRPGL